MCDLKIVNLKASCFSHHIFGGKFYLVHEHLWEAEFEHMFTGLFRITLESCLLKKT